MKEEGLLTLGRTKAERRRAVLAPQKGGGRKRCLFVPGAGRVAGAEQTGCRFPLLPPARVGTQPGRAPPCQAPWPGSQDVPAQCREAGRRRAERDVVPRAPKGSPGPSGPEVPRPLEKPSGKPGRAPCPYSTPLPEAGPAIPPTRRRSLRRPPPPRRRATRAATTTSPEPTPPPAHTHTHTHHPHPPPHTHTGAARTRGE